MNKAVVVVDALVDFMKPEGVLYCKTADYVIPKLKELRDAAHEANVPVFYVNDAHQPGDRELEIWHEHAMKGTKGAELVPELMPVRSEEIVEKRWYSGFTETDLDRKLKAMGVDTVYIAGMHTNICNRHTSYDAYTKGYKVVLVGDASGTFTPEDHAAGVDYIKQMYFARAVTVGEAAAEFNAKE
jgi:nicotinamidase-related amidase